MNGLIVSAALVAAVAQAPRSPRSALLEPPAGRVVHGRGQWEPYNTRLQDALPREVRPASELLFIQIGDSPRGWRGAALEGALRRIDGNGCIPSINITLSGNQPRRAELDAMADKRFGVDHLVASSDRFDSRLGDIVAAVNGYGKAVMVRIGGEFNGWWNGYHPYEYPKAFRKIVGMFRKAGAVNAAFVWCYEPAAPGDFDEKNAEGEWKWFPGDDAIDWFSIDWFAKEDFSGPLTGPRGETAHGRSKRFLDMAVSHRKPVVIAESAPCRYDLSDPDQAEAAWTEWFVPYFRAIEARPEIKWLHLISYDWSRATYYRDSGWRNNDLTTSPELLRKLIAELRKPRYLHAPDKGTLRDYDRLARAAPKPKDERKLPPGAPKNDPGPMSAEKALLIARFDSPKDHLPRSGAGGTEWDAQYRCFIQTDTDAVSKGLPTHADAAKAILADAARSPESLARHLGWVLHLKHFSQAYRPDPATADLRELYEDLVDLKLGGKPKQRPAGPAAPGVSILRDVVYGRTHPAIQKLDAYLVKSDKPVPAVIEFHGGGWRRGSKSQFVYPGRLIDDILGAGISVIAVDYRLAPAHIMPAQTDDAARAIQFVRSKAREWNLDPSRIAALGSSAGAHLSAWVALHDDLAKPGSTDPVERQSSRLAAFVDISGPMDLLRARPTELARSGLRGADFAAAFTGAFGCTAAQYESDPDVRKRVRAASPFYLVSPGDPPAFIMHAAGEEMGPGDHPPVPNVINDPHSAWHGVLLADALQKSGVAVTCRIGPEVGRDAVADNAAIVAWLRARLSARTQAK